MADEASGRMHGGQPRKHRSRVGINAHQAASLQTSEQGNINIPSWTAAPQHLRRAPRKTAINKAQQAERVAATLEKCQEPTSNPDSDQFVQHAA